jgi:hypothetical protein
MTGQEYRFTINFAHTGAIRLRNLNKTNIEQYHNLIAAGDMFLLELDDGRRWLVNPHYVTHTEVHFQND